MLITVVVPNWNGEHLLRPCLDSLRRQSHPDREIIVVDNASTDGSRDLIRSEYSEVVLIEPGYNAGFARGANIGIRAASGEVVALLNNDTEADPGWLSELNRAFMEHPDVSCCASKLLLYDRRDTLHSAGDFYGVDAVPGNRGVWQVDTGQYDTEARVFSACGGAAAYRKQLFDDIGTFDESLFMYCEDVDLAIRANLAGHQCLFVPAARVFHRLSASGGGVLASYYCGRNFIDVAVKNLPTQTIRRYWPGMLAAQLRFAREALAHFREPAARAKLRGQMAALAHLPRTIARRKETEKIRRISVQDFESLLARRG